MFNCSDNHELDPNWPRTNSEALKNLESNLEYLPPEQKLDLVKLVNEYQNIFKDSPGRTNLLLHDVNVGDSPPIKQHPYRLHPQKENVVDEEVQYMLKHVEGVLAGGPN